MDALSALKMMVSPNVGTQMDRVAQDAAASQSIPLPEMQQLNATSALQPSDAVQSTTQAEGGSFQNYLGDFVNDVQAKQAAASDAVNGLLSGKNVPLHQAMISMEEASVSFSMMVEVRNKLLDSYQELMRMQI